MINEKQIQEIKNACNIIRSYCFENKLRLLIEIEPDYENIYIYTDFPKMMQVFKIPYSNINYIETNNIILYKEIIPQIIYIHYKKEKIVHRFWKMKNCIQKENIFFIDLNGNFEIEEIKKYYDKVKEIDLTQDLTKIIYDFYSNIEERKIILNVDQNNIYLYKV